MGFGVWVWEFGVERFRVWAAGSGGRLGLKAWLGFRFGGLGFQVQGLGFRGNLGAVVHILAVDVVPESLVPLRQLEVNHVHVVPESRR